ncbi:Uu.00g129470.m01.CDS01 [Anthostomella pinea]|uniref:Uu.00g129470.m01.CDS01 n=1 Tax=Anthostomella pinea TaxID=933095 RepID=A0AAI8VII8_9PEZI|nr:Uu.00g129470.m01.CDS01 [Anthostomella pinea]
MNTTKRKFNALLQGIGARSSPQVSDSDGRTSTSTRDDTFKPSLSAFDRHPISSPIPDTSTPKDMATIGSYSPSTDLNKKRRVGVLGSTTANSTINATGLSSVSLKKWSPGNSTSTARKDTKTAAPKYCPGDRDELIRRLGTFQGLTEWTPKPDKVNEIEWAKRGWVCQGKERVRCILCHKELVVRTNKREVEGKEVTMVAGSDIEEAMVKKFAELIVEAHQEDCLWRKRGCDDSLLRLPLANPQTALASLRERYDDLCTRPSFLPYLFNLRLPATLDIQTARSQLDSSFFNDPPPPSINPSTPNDVALGLALTGWQGLTNLRIGAVPNTAACATCLRRLGLWMFKSKEVDESTGEILIPAPMDHLDPVREHRFFCPWRNGAAQRNPGSKLTDTKVAWEVLAQTVKNNSYLCRQAEKSNQRPAAMHRPTVSVPSTPSRGGGANEDQRLVMLGPDMGEDEDDDNTTRDAKDKERWARLRRVKSLFDTKNGKKLRRAISRPGSRAGTAASRPPTAHSRQDSVADDKSAEKA